ncbi:unnamed protein product [Cunninghamella blakesleeana]
MLSRRLIQTQVRSFSSTKYVFNSGQQQSTTRSSTSPPSISKQLLTEEEKKQLAPMIRVDESGEVGAYYIYKGQMAVLVGQHRVRPSLLRPVWEVAGFVVGAGTALIGKEAAMACTEAVETVIGHHYNDQLRELFEIKDHNKDLKHLSETIAKCRDEELEHLDTAVEHDAHRAPFHTALSAVIKQGCKTAIWVAERV